MPHTNEEMREEWNKLNPRGYNLPQGESFMVCDDNTIWDKDDIADHWLNKISDLKKSIREEIAKEKEHWEKHSAGNYKFGATEALNKILSIKPLE